MDYLAVIIKLTDLFIAGTVAAQRWQQIRQDLVNMQAEGRDPTPQEFEALLSQIDADSAAIEAADKRLNP